MRPAFSALGLVLLLGAGCRLGATRPSTTPQLPVTAIALDFHRAEEGVLSFALDIPQASARRAERVHWELWVSNVRFAAGVDARPTTAPTRDGQLHVTVSAPLVYRHAGWHEGASFIEVGVRGEVQMKTGERHEFRGRAEVLAHGSPIFDDGTR